jgi:hypothetical protein
MSQTSKDLNPVVAITLEDVVYLLDLCEARSMLQIWHIIVDHS